MFTVDKLKLLRLGITAGCLFLILTTIIGAETNTNFFQTETVVQNSGEANQRPGNARRATDDSPGGNDSSEKDSKDTAGKTTGTVPVTEVDVAGAKDDGTSNNQAQIGALGEQPLQDTPLAVNVISADSVANTQASRPSDALKYDPTVQATLGSNLSSDYFMIRGFSCNPSNSTLVDGLQSSVALEPVEDKEQIEVLDGSTNLLYGFSSPGGTINYILKRPTAEPFTKVTLGNYGGSQAYAHVDMGGPVDAAGKFGYRMNLLGVDKGDIGIENETHERYLISTAFDWHINENTLWSFDASKFHRKIEYQQAYFLIGSATEIPKISDPSKNYGAPYDFTEDTFTRYGTEFTSKLNDLFTLRSALRYTASENLSENSRNNLIDDNGDYTVQMQCKGTNQSLVTSGQLFLDASFQVGSISNKLSLGVVGTESEDKEAYPNGYNFYYFPTTDIFNIDDLSYPADPHYDLPEGGHLITTERAKENSVIIADQIKLNPKWGLLVGGNYATIHDDNWDDDGIFDSSYDKSKFAPGVALTYKPSSFVTTYASYFQSLQEGPTAPDTALNSGEVLDPYVNTQIEIGTKMSWNQINFNTALFRINKANAYTDPDTNIYNLDGREVHTGLEFTANSKVTNHFTIGGGFCILNAKITKTDTDDLLNKSPRGVPEKLFRLYSEYSVPGLPNLILTGGISYTGKVWINSANTLSIPAYTVGDLGLRYLVRVRNHDIIMRLTVNNVANVSYWTSKGDNMIYTGDPRIIAYSTELKF
ncbi:MAG TPA: hypothetical protein DDW65_00145 [Firmicutes bacterium]|jgi:iron complex outermembrane recepter protein|nr:hypothetical protein [Bacillota bacterium]